MSHGNAARPRRLLLIANPISGGGRGRRAAAELAAALQQRAVHASVHLTAAAGDATARALAAGSEEWDGLVAIGGDGTVNEVLNGMPDVTRPLGVFPVGTANVLALELGLPRKIDACAELLAHGRTRPLAIGRCGERRFLLFVGVGIDGAVVHRLSQVRTGTLGKHKWLGPILHTTWHWPRYALRATFADGEVLDDLASVLVTRVRNYGGVVHLPSDVRVDSGLLHVLCFRNGSRTAFVWHGLRGLFGRMGAGRDLEVRATTALRVEGSAPFQIDGDHGGDSPLELAILPQRAQLIAPR